MKKWCVFPLFRADGTSGRVRCSRIMRTPRASPDPADRPPDELEKERGSRTPSLGPWLVAFLILIAAAAAYTLGFL